MSMTISSYEELPYTTFALRGAHPSRLGALARLHGLDTPLPDNCSVLEIGCGTGGNLAHLAYLYPKSRFVGVDISPAHISLARELAQGSSLSNVEFRLGDFAEIVTEAGAFDYIMCHGVYSWIRPDLRERLMEVIKSALSAEGVAFISYNVLPGWRQRGAIRDIMKTGATLGVVRDQSSDPRALLAAGIELLTLVGATRKKGGDLFGTFVREALERMSDSDPSYLFHEFLEEHNDAVLFSDFIGAASNHGLQFLSEAKPALMSCDDLGPEVSNYLSRLDGDIIAREQTLDMLRNRMFRETLLCHSAHQLKRDLKASVFKSLRFVSDYRLISQSPAKARFEEVTSQRSVETPVDEHSRLLVRIGEWGYSGVSFEQLQGAIGNDPSLSLGERELMHAIVRLWRSGFIEAVSEAPNVKHVARGVPKISPIAHYQTRHGNLVTALQHKSFHLSSLELNILRAVDGESLFEDIIKKVGTDTTETRRATERLLTLGFFAGEIES